MTHFRLTNYILIFLALTLFTNIPIVEAQKFGSGIPQHTFDDAQSYQVTRIVDGDTVILLVDGQETRVRLIGVDTPETVHPQKPVEYYGKEASTFTRNLLSGESVYLEFGEERTDRYGRTLAYLYRVPDGLFVNFELVRQGYGHAYTAFPFKYIELFRHYEKIARESGKGLWAEPKVGTTPKFESSVPSDQHQKITVYITRTGKKYHRGNCRYLARSKIPIALQSAKLGYGACLVCQPPQ